MAALETALGVRLPADYRAFLRWMGRDEDGVWCGSECLVDDIVNNTKSLPELLVENGLAGALPERYVCVFSHQGYIAVWFEAPTDAADPPAFIFNEGQLELGIQTGRPSCRCSSTTTEPCRGRLHTRLGRCSRGEVARAYVSALPGHRIRARGSPSTQRPEAPAPTPAPVPTPVNGGAPFTE